MKVTESRSGARCTLTAGESVALLRLKEQQKGIWLVEELKLDRRSAQSWFARYSQQDLLAQKVKTKPGF
mgnify:CR=1 FL=1